jgi:uracil-DNA glycosylase family 4
VGLTLNVIREPDAFCKPCGAYKTCNHPVMNGSGSENPIYFFVGEAPGSDEDDKEEGGIPFIGEAGQLLKGMIKAIGISLKDCRFSNAVRCRPPNNNIKHYPNVVEQCQPHILREIHATRPKVVILLGNTAIKSVLKKNGIMKLHGEVFDAGLWKYVCCFHPAYLLRNDNKATELKFKAALKVARNIGERKKLSRTEKKRTHILVQDYKTLQEMRDHLLKQKYLATDIEGSTLNAYSRVRPAKLGCVGWAWSEMEACCFPIASRVGLKVKVPEEEFLEVMKEVWESPRIKHFTHFGKYDYVYSAVLHDIWLGGKDKCGYYADTGQMSYVLDERPGERGLKEWAYRLGMGGYEQRKRQYELEHKECNPEVGGNANIIPMDILGPYNMDDCIATWRLFWKLKKQLIEQKLWDRPFKFPQMWHQWTASILEINGLKISKKRNRQLDRIFVKRMETKDAELHEYPEVRKLQRIKDQELMEKIYERVSNYKRPPESVKRKVLELFENVPEEKKLVNLNAPENRRTLVFKILEYKPLWKTKKGKNWSVEKEVLERLLKKRKNKVLSGLLERNALASAHSKYIEPVLGWRGTDGRTHTNYSPHGQLTGRVSSRDPNHENLPKHGPLAKELRSQFVSSGPDYYIVEQDSKQIEMRLFADRANDDIMIQEFNEGKDPHAMGAMAGFEISEKKWLRLPDEERKELRFNAKSAISFGLLYGRGAEALAEDFQKPVKWAKEFINRYFGKYDDCLVYRQEREEYIRRKKIVYSHFFRPRRLGEVDSDDEAIVARAIREGINSPIQGDASDITWVALRRLSRWLLKYRMRSKAIIAVHDAGYVDTYYKEMEDVIERLHMYMTDRKFIERMTGWMCQVPWETDCTVGPNLGNMVELKTTSPGQFIVPKEFKLAA